MKVEIKNKIIYFECENKTESNDLQEWIFDNLNICHNRTVSAKDENGNYLKAQKGIEIDETKIFKVVA